MEEEDIDKTKDKIYQKLEHQRVAHGWLRCFPLYIWVWPNGRRRKKISIVTIILIYLMMLMVLVGVNLYWLFIILPDIINNDVFRIYNENLNNLVRRVSHLKKYDVQVLINDILIFDSVLGDVSKTPSHQSANYDPTNVASENPIKLAKGYDNPQDGSTVNRTAYYVRPKITETHNPDYAQYYQFTETFPWWKLLSKFFENYYNYAYKDMTKRSVYIGFGSSELFCQYPSFTATFFYEENDAIDSQWNGYSYNLDTKKWFYNPRLRPWYLDTKTDYGYTFLHSPYIFPSSGKYGNTMSITVRKANNQILGIVGVDFLPLGNESFINYNLFPRNSSSNADFSYLLLDPAYLNESFSKTEDFIYGEATWNTAKISNLLTELVYTGDTEEDTIKKRSIFSLNNEKIYYAEFTGGGKQRLMFFSPWYLNMRAREDQFSKTVVGDVFVLISTKEFFDEK